METGLFMDKQYKKMDCPPERRFSWTEIRIEEFL